MGTLDKVSMNPNQGYDPRSAHFRGASPTRYNQTHCGGNAPRGSIMHEGVRQRSSRLDSSPVTTMAGSYRGNPYLCGTHIEAHPQCDPNYRDSHTAQSMMRYGYGHPFNPHRAQAARDFLSSCQVRAKAPLLPSISMLGQDLPCSISSGDNNQRLTNACT